MALDSVLPKVRIVMHLFSSCKFKSSTAEQFQNKSRYSFFKADKLVGTFDDPCFVEVSHEERLLSRSSGVEAACEGAVGVDGEDHGGAKKVIGDLASEFGIFNEVRGAEEDLTLLVELEGTEREAGVD